MDPARQAFIDFLNSVMRECLRVLKPGGRALAWAIPRTSLCTHRSRMADSAVIPPPPSRFLMPPNVQLVAKRRGFF